jgi:hypothetical protein
LALYKYPQHIGKSQDAAFDEIREPGAAAPYSGIYRCEECGTEIASNAGNPLPPRNHHQHASGQGPIRWRLIIVYAQSK